MTTSFQNHLYLCPEDLTFPNSNVKIGLRSWSHPIPEAGQSEGQLLPKEKVQEVGVKRESSDRLKKTPMTNLVRKTQRPHSEPRSRNDWPPSSAKCICLAASSFYRICLSFFLNCGKIYIT